MSSPHRTHGRPGQRPNRRLRALLAEARWTQGALARAVNAAAAEVGLSLGYDRTSVAHWLSGTRPRAPVPELVAEVLTRRLQRTVSPDAAGFTAASGPRAKRSPEAELVALAGTETDPARTITAQQQPYREALLRTARLDIPVPRNTGPRHGGSPAEAETRILQYAERFYAASLDAHGGRSARSSLAAYLTQDVTHWLRSARTEHARRALLVEASRLTFLLARMYEDARVHGLAQRCFVTSQRLAAESGDRLAWAIGLRGLSAQGLALGHHQAALHAAEAAAEAGQRADGGGPGAYLFSQLAAAQAACGLRRQALRSLGHAERCLESAAEQGHEHGPFTTYPPAALDFQRARVLGFLGDFSAACEALTRSLALRPATDRRGLALSHAQRAEILLRNGHVEEACISWHSFLEHYRYLRSGTADTAAFRLRRLLTPYRRIPAAAQVLARAAAERAGRYRRLPARARRLSLRSTLPLPVAQLPARPTSLN
ncbi:tetratricopeptide repeat protein [Streptomyces morookaense]|uniref:Tetratricopeptide repeat protein n=1 Tax=Streptomyces morookaense TaxID=1970 RepID=A0A7Y7B956_STRMO|nr:tetratricopeptide repeat protein [Streptomyces morookaense]NVK81328.1 tetratricopeptide repeat protein [Streptomyces morookaense]GHF35456.1 hypothetical protein GCM10010359_42530 [Streptomyces morookaense]